MIFKSYSLLGCLYAGIDQTANVNFDFITAILPQLIGGLLGLFAVWIGVRAITKDLKLRGVDSICGFYAKLSVKLRRLQRDGHLDDAKNISSTNTVFLWMASNDTVRKNAESEETVKSHFTNDELSTFIETAKSIVEMFEKDDGQIPLSKNLRDRLIELYATLSDMIDKREHGRPFPRKSMNGISGDLLATSVDIKDKAKEVSILINDIICEIDIKTKRLLRTFWDSLEKNSRIDRGKHPIPTGKKYT